MDQNGPGWISLIRPGESGPEWTVGRMGSFTDMDSAPWIIDITVILPRNRVAIPPARLSSQQAVRLRNPRLPQRGHGSHSLVALRQGPALAMPSSILGEEWLTHHYWVHRFRPVHRVHL
ncbi:hypothetical protein N7532_004348 [Penicillium argentinense]|uniref:Uncharacterized protein n=1 Tax=Penicillium argentinense TaxID=1131581 RepID=A0A9W9FPB2_9EURO|nr:uncharacterized protein N7532_004348 [Penicillium argentinense]KAJ5103819.1 hypothetical protein N7532_004348 [Penicillium argentinense]